MKGRSLHRSWPKLLAALGVCAAVAVACSGGQNLPPGMNGSGGSAGSTSAEAGGPCTNGQTRDCHVKLGEHNGVLSCYEGTQTCVGGTWGACGDGTVTNVPAPGGDGGAPRSGQALSSPTHCQNDPCDPYCQNFNEQPDAGVTADGGGSKYNWQGGTLSNLSNQAPGLVNKGLKQPCSDGYDCQFNEYCQHPVTGTTCSHSKCQTGTGLIASCDSCVADICAADPTCCDVPAVSSCTHDPCSSGPRLKSNCNSCVSSICAVDPYCCWSKGYWDKYCVADINSVCGQSCPLGKKGTWSQSCVDKVNSVCNAKCGQPTAATCTHNPCSTGGALPANCNSCVTDICTTDPYCCSVQWDSICKGEVGTVCGQSCPVNIAGPPPEDGTCVPWLPGQTDSSCSGYDLSVGIACDQNGVGTIPVCNHGTQTAPKGIPIATFAANSNQYPKCAPDLAKAKATCTTNAPIPPGQCIDVANCLPLNQMEIMVNPVGATGHQAECNNHCQDNWSLYKSGATCGPPTCSGAKSQATFKPVNLYFIVDKSGSMGGGKWTGTTDALKAFFQDPGSAGIGAALEYFALSSGGSYGDGCGVTCSATPCSNPMVPLGKLTAQSAPADTQEQSLVNALGLVSPGGMTPTYPALDGALTWAKNNQTADPNQQYVVVLVTDGVPTVCDTSINDIAALAGNAYINNSIRTYTIAMDGADVAALDQIAKEGGTGSAFVISGTNSNNVQQQMISAFQAIAGQNVSCSFPLPNQGQFDPNDATVTYTASSGSTTTLPQVQSSANCGAGWYYDNNTNPTTITLCKQTCTLVQADAGAKVAVQLGCPKTYSPVTYTQTYQATCPSGTLPQWGYLAYDSTTPSDSNILFQVRTAADQPSLTSASYVSAATAQASPVNTQVCPMSGPSPCPVDLYSKLGKFNAINQYLELQITLNPTSDGSQAPTVNNWQITYSCPPAQ